MNKNRKKMICLIYLSIIIGGFGFVGFSPMLADLLKKASAQNEGEIGENIVLTEQNTEDLQSTQESHDTLTIDDTIYAVSAGEGENYVSLSTIESVDNLTAGTNYKIESYADWAKLYDFSQGSTLKDMIFWLYYPDQSTTSKPWDLNSTYIQTGIGSQEYPFSGIIKPFYTDMTIKTSVPLFSYLSSDAIIGNASHSNNPLTIANIISSSVEGNGAGGLATNYVIQSGETITLGGTQSKLQNLKITGTIDVKGAAGGLFGIVSLSDTAGAAIDLNSDSISLNGITEVKGYIAGGLFGEVSGNITMTLNSMPSVAAMVNGYYDSNTKYGIYEDGMVSQMKICAGGLIGKMTNEAVLQTHTSDNGESIEDVTYLLIRNKVKSAGISGGLVGAIQNSTINVSYIEKDSVESTSSVESYVWARYIGGGFIGLADSSKIELDNLKLNADIKVCYTGAKIKSSAGGIIGKYITDSEDKNSYLKISNISTGNTQRLDTTATDTTQRIMVHSSASNNNNCGGIIGSCNGNQVEFKNINLSPDSYNVSLNYAIWTPDVPDNKGKEAATSYVIAGAVAGSLSGMSIEIADVVFDLRCTNNVNGNGLAGCFVGDIAGRVGIDQSVVYLESENIEKINTVYTPTKMKISNISVKNSYVYSAYKYQGGLFGYVGKGALICLSDTIDISQIPFATLTSSNSNFADRYTAWAIYVMLAPEVNGGSRGLIAGYAEESLIYFEEGSVVTKSIRQDETGDLVSNMLDSDGKTYVTFEPDNSIYYDYVIDDIGNTGSVFQNFSEDGSKIIQYDNTYGQEVTGTIENSEGKYVIDSLGDALRLAIAGQAYDSETGELIFTSGCFEEGITISNILSADYLITADLNLGDANILSFLRNDAASGFSGSVEGQATDGVYPTITMNSVSRQKSGGLYPLLKSDSSDDPVSFKNLTLDGYLYYHLGSYNTTTGKSEGGSGSIAARAIGSCSFENITIKTKMKGDMYNTIYNSQKMYCHGGLIGEYQLDGGTLNVIGCEFSPIITTVRSNNFIGGMIGRIDTSGKVGNININNCTVGANITADSNYLLLKSTDEQNKFHARSAGLISFIGNDYADMYKINTQWAKFYPGTVEDNTYAYIDINDIEIKDASLDLTAANSQYVNISGGLFGYAWCNVETTMDNITIEGCEINSLGYVGGLVSFVAGKFDVSNITLKSLAMTSVDGGRSYSGLLFGNGECAYITLDQSTYNIDTPADVTITNYSDNFDEIVGSNVLWTFSHYNNQEFESAIYEEYRDGGIVNIINSNFSDFASSNSGYQSYVNRVCTTTNQYTRYYYNLFTDNDGSWNLGSGDLNIDSPKKLMAWHVGNYANTTLTRFFAPYFGGNTSYRDSKSVTMSGTLDMNGYSLYPTSVDGVQINGSGAAIILYGEEISDLENQLKTNSSSLVYRNNDWITKTDSTYTQVKTQHYLMHSALLYCVNGAGLSGLTMKGTVANNSKNSGSLIGGYANGNITISNIVFDGLRISHYKDRNNSNDEQNSAGLMLGQIGIKGWNSVSSSVNISGITMEGYDGISVGTAAAALISTVGNSETKDVQISFTDMKLMDKTATSPFNYASLIYRFEYSSDSKDNKTYGIYTFDYADTVDGSNTRDDHNVTYGEEIKDGLHYDDCYIDDIPEGQDNPLEEAIVEAGSGIYLPYVANNKDIYVNPKSGDITKGCGTYEDPYIIENVSQFMTLFCYLTGEHDTYHSFLQPANNGWKVVPIGGDGNAYECNKSHDDVVATYGVDANFPTVDDMRTAYYMITADIDLVNDGDMNYSALIKRFSGLGSYKYPFSGVIVGQKADGELPEITLPGKDHDYTKYSNLGLVEYMQGAVIKDLNIKNNGWAIVTNSTGGVAAIILGGDNIIDNVTVSMEIRINNAIAGGYVGNIKNGSLILRNMESKNVVAGCKFFNHYTNANNNNKADCYTQAAVSEHKGLLTTNNQVGLLVGKIEDGYVLYDGSEFGSDAKVLTNDVVNATGLEGEVSPLINGFELINGAALDATVLTDGRVRINDNKQESTSYIGENNYEVRINNAEQLEIIALALNSDSLSVYIDESHSDAENRTNHLSGYDYTAKCRKANYTDVGSEAAKNGTSTDCQFAKNYDDGWVNNANIGSSTMNYYSYPYLCYKYMRFNYASDDVNNYNYYKTTICEVSSGDAGNKYISKLNKADENVKQYTTTYKLRSNSTSIYDLSVYGNSFRGIGALYSKEYSDFRGNFDGGGFSVKIYMERDWDPTLAITGMFNSLTYHNKNAETGVSEALTIENFSIVDSVFQNTINTETMATVKSTNELQGASCGAATGSLAGEMEGAWEIKDITVKRDSAEAQSMGSLYAVLRGAEYTKELVCGVRGYMNVGGLIGRINVTDNVSTSYGDETLHKSSNDISIKRCNIVGVSEEKAVNIQAGSNSFAAGGLIGSIGANINSREYNANNNLERFFYFGNVIFEGCSVTNTNVLANDSGFLGGFAGTVGYRVDQKYRSVGSVKVTINTSTQTNNYLSNLKILSDTQNDTYDKYSAGGVFGQVEVLAVKQLVTKNGKTYRNVDINSVEDESSIWYTYLDNVIVNNQSTNDSNGTYNLSSNSNGIGGLVGYLNCRKMSLFGVEVKNSYIGVCDGVYAKTNVGGLIGFSSSNGAWYSKTGVNSVGFYANFLAMSYVKVTNTEIKCDQPYASSGGFVGYLSNDATSIWGAGYSYEDGGNIVSRMGYSRSQNNTISCSGVGSYAGGIIGYAKPSSYVLPGHPDEGSMTNEHWICYTDVIKNKITSETENAGGIVGYFAEGKSSTNDYYYNHLYVGAIRIGNQEDLDIVDYEPIEGDVSNQIIGFEHAGGLCGFTDAMTGLMYVGPIKVGTINENNYYNTIAGRVAGGLVGKNCSNYEYFSTGDIEILQNRIAGTSTKSHSLDGQVTVSGGVCGVRYYNKAVAIKASYKIKNNVIVSTGRANETLENYVKFSCGGVYGKVDWNTNSNYSNSNKQYFDDMVLSNNSIGYYKIPSIDNTDDLNLIVGKINELTNESDTVCLLKRSSSGFTYDNWRNFDINELNVGDYADRIGVFFGEYTDAALYNLHCMILRPEVEFSENIGSIPAVEVGQTKSSYRVTTSPSEYGTAYPYGYRAKCHIISLDDYLDENDQMIDISNSEDSILPNLHTSVLMQHGSTEAPQYETEYFFGGIEKIVSEYEAVKNIQTTGSDDGSATVSTEEATYAFLTSRRLDITLGGTENSNLVCASPDKDDYFETTYVHDENKYNGVPVIEVNGQSVQYIGDYVAEILTNGGGICNGSNTFKSFLTISCVNAYIAPDGTIYAVGDNNVVGDTGVNHNASIVVTDNELSSQDCPYDVVIEQGNDKYYTISLLCYTYHSYSYDQTEKKETIYIPVFVTKKVTVNSYLSILEGEEYSLEQAVTNGYKDNVVISHDSTYTVYSEFVYDDVRKEDGFSDIEIEKTLVFETNKADGYEAINMQSGTKYTLIDVQTGKEYYYMVPEGGVSEIPFSSFVDADGEPYSQRNIGDGITTTKTDYTSITYKDSTASQDTFEGEVGLERFFIVVRPSGKDNNMSFRLSIKTKAVDANDEDKEESVRKFLAEGVNITNIYGPLIGFEGLTSVDNVLTGTEGVTEITGKISRDETLKVDGRIRVSVVPENDPNSARGGSPYWINKANGNTIDSANAGKYLEIGVTLIDEDGQEVQWPEGTNIIINGGNPKPLQGNSVIYTYKDNGETFAFDTLSHDIANGEWYYYNVSGDDNTPEYRWITYDSDGKWYYKEYQKDANGNLNLSTVKLDDSFVFDNDKIIVSNQCHLEFDFSVADIKDYAGKSYTVRINLYRSSDPEFPLEEAGVAVADGSIREYAKTIFAEGAADLAAAITPDDLLDLGINLYHNSQTLHEIPFSNKLDFTDLISEKEPKLSADVADCAAQKYMVTYRIYKKTKKSDGSGYQYDLVSLNDANSPFTLYEIAINGENQTETIIPIKEITLEDGTKEYAFVTSQEFTADEIKAGTEGKTAYVTSWKMKLAINSTNMTETDLANYKIEATYLPYEGEQPSSDSESTLKDYFIFTIAKLKTDF
ncbi:MAG: hypothetical protein IJA10_00760 [Lachnospiraceae bacterium]|nr:hypothetical protein [Lachnospiraceae bacterium]